MLQSVKEDIFRYYGHRCTSIGIRIKYALLPGGRTMWLIRHYQASSLFITKRFWELLCYFDKFSTGMQIPPQTNIGRGCRISHFGNIVINPSTRIGSNFNISQGCLIGNSWTKGVHGTPVIGNNCCVGANAIIIGKITIGDDVLVAPGAFVNFDVPSNSIVIGNPGKIIARNSSPTRRYIVYPVESLLR